MAVSERKHALITGTSSGIGAAIAQTLLEQGWKVTGLSRQPGALTHSQFTHQALDVTDLDALQDYLAHVTQVDAVIHAAGMMKAAPLGQPNVG